MASLLPSGEGHPQLPKGWGRLQKAEWSRISEGKRRLFEITGAGSWMLLHRVAYYLQVPPETVGKWLGMVSSARQ
ncbi:MAG: hypothetical protein DLM70_17195 [Chloroflexi bacterium]|nr:MAG: hypothetical protein DLM70_17195 [Chloroflexota bacterium]